MSDSLDATLILLGLKGTGKTHYLVALDWVLDRQSDIEGLVHSELADDRAYLQPLREMWLRGEEFERTSRQNPPPPHQLILSHPASGKKVGFHLPDLAGETFESYYVTRSFPKEFCERVSSLTGLFLFIHCDSNADHAILEHPGFIDSISQSEFPKTTGEAPRDWILEDTAHQSKLVDLLQIISEIRFEKSQLRIAVMLSAWDLVEKAPKPTRTENPNDPNQFLAERWPLLHQYLRNNEDTFKSRVFGVSARGGGNTKAEIERLTNFENPSDRISLVDGAHRSSDLSRPVRWLLGLLDPP